ncbi:MAG: hypothetical protein LBL75_02255 [Rickettsiales bacterium]|jgi:hypothetical protein|nr:hypothetical protein [Rickettsiales bacterium]
MDNKSKNQIFNRIENAQTIKAAGDGSLTSPRVYSIGNDIIASKTTTLLKFIPIYGYKKSYVFDAEINIDGINANTITPKEAKQIYDKMSGTWKRQQKRRGGRQK